MRYNGEILNKKRRNGYNYNDIYNSRTWLNFIHQNRMDFNKIFKFNKCT